MVTKVFVIYDAIAEFYDKPFYAQNETEAKRIIHKAAMDNKTKFFLYPDNYALFFMGVYDDVNCQFDIVKTPVKVGTVLEISLSMMRQKNLQEQMEEISRVGLTEEGQKALEEIRK